MTDEKLPEGALVKVEMEIRVPIGATEAEIDEWLRFNLGANGSLDMKNALSREPVEVFGSFGFDWEYSGETGREERTLKEERADGSKTYSVKYRREAA